MLARRLPRFVAAYTDKRSARVRPNLSACSAASLRLVAPSLPRIADTWCSTVLTDMNKLSGDFLVGVALGNELEDLLFAYG